MDKAPPAHPSPVHNHKEQRSRSRSPDLEADASISGASDGTSTATLSKPSHLHPIHQNGIASGSRSEPGEGSGSGTSPNKLLKTLVTLPEKNVTRLNDEALRRLLIQIHELAVTVLFHTSEQEAVYDVLCLMRDLTQTETLSLLESAVELWSTYTTIQALGEQLP